MKRLKQITIVLVLSGFIFTQNPYAQNNIVKTKSENSEIVLPPLPYAENELEPYISAQTVMLHYGKHLKGYIDNVNRLIKEISNLEGKDLETIVKQSEGSLYNNAAQAWNHIFYFDAFSPHAQHLPSGNLEKQINKQWGNFENFKTAFTNTANNLFGSGWVWLIKNKNGTLDIIGESNAGNVLKGNGKPLLGVDIWEHAYYLKYTYLRKKYLENIFDIIDFDKVYKLYLDNIV